MDKQEQINKLSDRLENLVQRQESFIKEIVVLRNEIRQLRDSSEDVVEDNIHSEVEKQKVVSDKISKKEKVVKKTKQKRSRQNKKSNIEEFIGENLIGKIGIIIFVIGVGIGAKYAIDKQMLGPLMRIILAYVFGLALLGFAIKLKAKYENYSAMLLSGAMAILYFVSYAAYSYYAFIPQSLTFVLMLVFTVFTVFAALSYNRQVIAIYGLVGAYTIPFLLSDGSGKVLILLSYMTIINLGILFLSFKKYWKPLFYSSFSISWIIIVAWYAKFYEWEEHLKLTIFFVSVFFIIFYVSFLAYKLIKKEQFDIGDIILLLSNAFIFYGLGYSILDNYPNGEVFLGIFTLVNAILHFIVSMMIKKQKLSDKNLFYFVLGLVLVFITIAIPVQLDGRWVTLLWAGEAILFYFIGLSKKVAIYEKIAYPLAILAFISLVHDWSLVYDYKSDSELKLSLFFNVYFLTSLIVAGVSSLFIYLKQKYSSNFEIKKKMFANVLNYTFIGLLMVVLYFAFTVEISYYYDKLLDLTKIARDNGNEYYSSYFYNQDLTSFKDVWIYNFSLFYLVILTFLNWGKFKNKSLGSFSLALNTLVLFSFLSRVLWILSELRDTYLNPEFNEHFPPDTFYLSIRYISIVIVILLLVSSYLLIRAPFMKASENLTKAFQLVLHVVGVWLLSSELLHWMNIYDAEHAYKLGLSILWGVYALFMIVIGIARKIKVLRIMAIFLFGITLIKLFAYDISHLNMLYKFIIFISLGALLLIISFLYTKYKHLIFENEADSEEKKLE